MRTAGWLLDTHAMLWMLYGDRRLSRNAKRIIQGSPSLYYSTVSFWEIALKRVRIGFDFEIEDDWDVLIPEGLREAGTLAIGLEASDCRLMEDLPLHHRDPFDRLMISQALRRRIGVLSRDDQWDAYGVERVW
jgi:PIN domain nuclease of toxin-antitoxin system